jgi:hypothetical protein
VEAKVAAPEPPPLNLFDRQQLAVAVDKIIDDAIADFQLLEFVMNFFVFDEEAEVLPGVLKISFCIEELLASLGIGLELAQNAGDEVGELFGCVAEVLCNFVATDEVTAGRTSIAGDEAATTGGDLTG